MAQAERQSLFEVAPGLLADGFTAMPNMVLRRADLTPTARLLYAVILDIVWQAQEEPTLASLGAVLGGGEKLARTALRELADAGLLRVIRRGQGNPNRYELLAPGESLNGPEGGSRTASRAVPFVVKTLEKTSEANASAQPASQELVAHYVDQARTYGSDPPRRLVGQIARLAGELLTEGVPADRIRAGIDLNLERRLHPATLPSCVHEAAMGRSPPPGRVTGWRFARGSHGSTYVPDPAGTDVPPRGFT